MTTSAGNSPRTRMAAYLLEPNPGEGTGQEIEASRLKLVLAAGQQIGSASSAYGPLLVQAALDALREHPGELVRIQEDFRGLASSIENATSQAEVQAVLLSRKALAYGLDELVRVEEAARRLVPHLNGAPGFPGMEIAGVMATDANADAKTWFNSCDPKAVARRAGKALLAGDAKAAGDVLDTVFAALGKVKGHADVSDIVNMAVGDGFDQIVDFLNKVPSRADLEELDEAAAKEAKSAIESRAKEEMNKVINAAIGSDAVEAITSAAKAVGAIQDLGTAVKDFKWDSNDLSDTASQAHAASTAVASLLSVLGQGEAAKVVKDASGYLQSAAQVQKYALMLATPAGYVGAAIAIAGLAGGLGGMGAFGGGSDDGARSTAQHQAVMAAIAELQKKMMEQFAKVNERLDEMNKALGTILEELKKQTIMLGAIQAGIDRIQRTLDVMLLWQEDRALEIMEEIREGQERQCKTEAAEMDANGKPVMKERSSTSCMDFYGDKASDALRKGLRKSGSDEDNVKYLALVFGAGAGGAESETDDTVDYRWRSARVVRDMLMHRGLKLAGEPHHEPMLVGAVEGMTTLYGLLGKDYFLEVKGDNQKLVRTAMTTAAEAVGLHKTYIRELREKAVLEGLLKLYKTAVENFMIGIADLRSEACDQLIKEIGEGRWQWCGRTNASGPIAWKTVSPTKPVVMENLAGAPGQRTLKADADTAALRLLTTPVVSKPYVISLVLGGYQTKNGGPLRFISQQYVTVDCAGQRVVDGEQQMGNPAETNADVPLLFDSMSEGEMPTLQALLDARDFLGALRLTNGKSGSTGGADKVDQRVLECIERKYGAIRDAQAAALRDIGAVDQRTAAMLIDPKRPWNASTRSRLEELEKASVVLSLMKAVLQTVHATAYGRCDLIQAMIEGGRDYQLLSWDSVQAWAKGQSADPKPGQFDFLKIKEREKAFEALLGQLQEKSLANTANFSLGLAKVSADLDSMIHDYF